MKFGVICLIHNSDNNIYISWIQFKIFLIQCIYMQCTKKKLSTLQAVKNNLKIKVDKLQVVLMINSPMEGRVLWSFLKWKILGGGRSNWKNSLGGMDNFLESHCNDGPINVESYVAKLAHRLRMRISILAVLRVYQM